MPDKVSVEIYECTLEVLSRAGEFDGAQAILH